MAARVARDAHGRLLALLARRAGDIRLAEDALADALAESLDRWPRNGVPEDPEAWIFAVATRRLVGHWRKAEVRRRKATALQWLRDLEASFGEVAANEWPDERLSLLFVCGHPAIDKTIRAPLMLQTVLGLSAVELAPMLAMAPKTLGQRLWRAKQKIRVAQIPFEPPSAEAMPARLGAVLDAIYGMYGFGWIHEERNELAMDAAWLACLVAEALPNEPEAAGLHSLITYSRSRAKAVRVDGRFVPFDQQDLALWDAQLIGHADTELRRAGQLLDGRLADAQSFQLESAIQCALVHGRLENRKDPAGVVVLYDALIQRSNTLGARVGRAAAIAERDGPAAGLAALDAIAAPERFQPWWAVRADCLRRSGADAGNAYRRAIALCSDPAVVSYLEAQLAERE